MNNPTSARILADSISPDGVRLTTMEVRMHRFVLAEFNTHRVFSRNSASSRAIPVDKMLQRVESDPAYPVWWGENQPGMQAAKELDAAIIKQVKFDWEIFAHNAVAAAKSLFVGYNLHKQLTNRLLEPFMWHTVIVTSSAWANYFNQRCHPDAQPEMRAAAEKMMEAYADSIPVPLGYGEWHLPLISEEDRQEVGMSVAAIENLKNISVARCARVSYTTHDGKRSLAADLDLYYKLMVRVHPSPFEHVATPCSHMRMIKDYEHMLKDLDFDLMLTCRKWGNFYGWHQYRKMLPGENRTDHPLTNEENV